MADPVTIANAVGWGISILGWVVSPVISKLVNKGLDYLDVTGSSAQDLQNLEKKLGLLKLMLGAAEAVPPGGERAESVERWVKDLKSAFYDADDILDEIDYHSLLGKALLRRRSVNTAKEKATAKESKLPPGLKDRLRKTLKEIENLIDEGQKLLPLRRLTTSGDNTKSSPEQTMASGSPSKTTSEPPKVFGRDEDAKKIISMLHDDTTPDHSVIGIHGISGSGKTTLAQNVCVCEKNSGVPYFELIMWIHVTKNFSVHTIYNEMLEIVLGQQKDKFSNLDMLQTELKKSLKDKRFLLVLDDVWNPESENEKNALEKLLSPLKEADKGSRVLVTTRSADAAKSLGAQNPMPISDMSEGEFFKMFMHYALDNSTVGDQETRSKFETVGKDIAALLRRSPLAARTVAGQLRIRTRRAEDIGFWIDTLNRKRDLLKDTVMGPLWWSYHQLEEPVRQCFAYCSMFPRRYELDRDELVKMWMAQGFVDTSENSDMEVAARECFQVLLSTSFIQLVAGKEGSYYTVHDLLHDLAERVAGSDCFRIENEMMDHKIPQDVRHLFIGSYSLGELMDQILKLHTLRTLVISADSIITTEEFQRMLKDLKKLRFVHVWLESFVADVFPDCIGELKHLRYLCLDGIEDIIILPPTFTKLYHLQEISVPWADELRCSDSNHMADLENLRRIEGAALSIPDIGRMQWLQTLSSFIVKKEKGYEITQLEKLNNIRGGLRIRGLVNIQSKEEARRANLSNKLHISALALDWKSYDDVNTGSSSRKKQKTARHHQRVVTPEPEEILEALRPPALLVQLWIKNYGGSTFPSWLSGEDGKLKHLERLQFDNCHGSGSQLKFTKPIPELHTLWIYGCSWNALPDIEQLASLQELGVFGCPNIQSPPGLPSSLKKLQIERCPNINTLPELPPSLKKLHIERCPNIKTLPELPPSLEYLKCNRALMESYPDKEGIGRIKRKSYVGL